MNFVKQNSYTDNKYNKKKILKFLTMQIALFIFHMTKFIQIIILIHKIIYNSLKETQVDLFET